MKRIEIITISTLLIMSIICNSLLNEAIKDRDFRWKEEVMYSTDVLRLVEILDSMEIYRETVDDNIYQLCKDRIYELTEYEDWQD